MDFDFEDEPSRLRGPLRLVLAVALIGGAVTAGWYFLIRDEVAETVQRAQQEVRVKSGQLVSSFQTTGSAASGVSADLSSGRIVASSQKEWRLAV